MSANLQQQRMQRAYAAVKAWPEDEKKNKELTQRVKGLPVALRTQGLAVTLATLMKNQRALSEALAQWLLVECPHRPLDVPDARQQRISLDVQLLDAAVRSSRPAYLAAQAEALAFLEHVKRFAEALEKAK